jgi:hypothetical protein
MDMSEIVYAERITVTKHGRTMLQERGYRGTLDGEGKLHLLSYYEKRFPYPNQQTEPIQVQTTKQQERVA